MHRHILVSSNLHSAALLIYWLQINHLLKEKNQVDFNFVNAN